MFKILIIGAGGFIGAIGRYLISGLVHNIFKTNYPLGTFAVNIIGCFLIGVVMYLVQNNQMFSPNSRLFLTIGILGAFTTFSTFGYETLVLLMSSEYKFACLNIFANVIIGLLAVWGGYIMFRIIKA